MSIAKIFDYQILLQNREVRLYTYLHIMSQNGDVFVLGAEQPVAKVIQSRVSLKNDLPLAARAGARGFGERFFIPSVTLVAASTALVARGIRGQLLILTRLAHGLRHDKVGNVSGLSAPRLETPLTFTILGGGVAFFALRYTVLCGLEVEENKFLDRFLGLFRKQVTPVIARDPGMTTFTQPFGALVQFHRPLEPIDHFLARGTTPIFVAL